MQTLAERDLRQEWGTGDYQIIYADPPWAYRDKAASGKRGASFKYDCLTVEDIGTFEIDGLHVSQIAAKNSALFLWSTGPMMKEARWVMGAWGFAYKNIAFTWVKRTKHDKLHWGMGNYTRSNPEFCLLGIRGKMKRQSASVHSIIEAPVGKHSAKPPEARDRIVRLFGDLPRIELFARERALGWDADGLELGVNDA
ncbi:hypothetical protein LCGC14_2107720 [marine sediment metagenome]|uniref:DNA methyltransferase n=1 Tax=marine sediment metagenome TaxID=412755 RepID=A0A0F9H4A6_9ZZZZ